MCPTRLIGYVDHGLRYRAYKKRLGDTILKSPHTYSMREGKSNRKKRGGGNDETHELINKRRDRLSHNVM